jgi:hypothetical protein
MTRWFDESRRRRAVKRITVGDGRALKRFRWWQLLTRSLFYLTLTAADGRRSSYAVDVGHLGDPTSGDVTAQLFLDGRQHAVSKTPAVFPITGGVIEVATSAFGLKRCHYVPVKGPAQQLTADAASAEGLRAAFDREYPAVSRGVGILSLTLLAGSLLILIPQLLGTLSLLPPVAEYIGTFVSPIQLPAWLNATVTVVTVAASTERALRLRHNVLLDGGAG